MNLKTKLSTLGLATLLLSGTAYSQTDDFSSYKIGNFSKLKNQFGQFEASSGHGAINKKSVDKNQGTLHLLGGKGKSIVLSLNEKFSDTELISLSFQGERWTRSNPFEFKVEARSGGKWKEVYNGNKLAAGGFSAQININLGAKKYQAFRFTSTTKDNSGVLIDNLALGVNKDMEVASVKVSQTQTPVLIRKSDSVVLQVAIHAEGARKPESVEAFKFNSQGTTQLSDVNAFKLYSTGTNAKLDISKATLWNASNSSLSFTGDQQLLAGTNYFWLVCDLKGSAAFDNRIDAQLELVKLTNAGIKKPDTAVNDITQRIGFNVATSGDEVVRTTGEMVTCKRMRIPGMATSNKGTVLAVYDLRWFQNGDLPGDVDVGLSRSTDGGQSWEAPRPVLDMEKFRGMPENKNGVGDPAILVDKKTNHVFISGLFAHGLSSGWYWGKSKPGMDPADTGQVVIVKSEDDGKTWGKPVNITPTIKDPAWQLMLQGPGAGISMRDGTLVFAFQYKVNVGTKSKPKYSARSSIMYSKDHGDTWVVAKGVTYPQETTEAQVVELDDGSLMLNCRISAGGRAVFTTKDLGENWTQHPTSGRGAFNMTGCMASILRYSSVKDGDDKSILIFSGPADGGKKRRSHMSIKYSLDEGNTWSTPYLLDQLGGAYSCLTLVEKDGEKAIAVIYEGSQSNMCYEVITIDELMAGK